MLFPCLAFCLLAGAAPSGVTRKMAPALALQFQLVSLFSMSLGSHASDGTHVPFDEFSGLL